MTSFNFNNKGRAYVSENEFFQYIEKTKRCGDYYKDFTDYINYYNGFGCLLAQYNRRGRYGITF